MGFYKFIKVLEYETANPGQDFNDKEAEVFQVDEDTAATAADVARPNIAVGRSDYIADEGGIHRSQDVRAGGGQKAPKKPANYSNLSPVREPTTPVAGTSPRGGRYDGDDSEKSDARRSRSYRKSGSEERHEDTYLSGETYRAGSDLENGELGGNYRVSGL